jgi:tetratricopeptide (TPR) repeat protein
VYQILLFLAMTTAGVSVASAECLSFEKTAALFASSSGGTNPAAVSGECFCSLLSNIDKNAAEVMPLIEAYARRHSVSDTLLFCAYRKETIRKNASIFSAIIHAWKRHNPSPASRVQFYRQTGAFRAMDTLCAILDYDGNLDAYLLLRWIDAKQVLEDLEAIPQLFCRVLQDKPELLPLALNQFEMLLQEVTSESAASMLNTFCEYGIGKDTLTNGDVLQWVIEQYGAKRLFTEQIDAAVKYTTGRMQRYELLRDIAQRHILSRNYIPASIAASAAYPIAVDAAQKQGIAALLFKSYKERGESDSARTWFERAGALVSGDPLEKVEVLLASGDYRKAAEHIGILPESIARDTLTLRRLLLSDSPSIAFNIAFSENKMLARSPFAVMWRVRTALFAGNTGKCREILDSIRITPSDATASELLDYRYWLMRLSDSPEDLAKFVQIEYTMFKGEHEKASQIVCTLPPASENRWRIAVRTARRQLAFSEYAGAIATLQCTPADKEPEYLFCYADALYRNKELQKSKKMLERLIMEFPSGMYSAQARNLHSLINK